MAQNSPFFPPEPKLVGDPSREMQSHVGLSVALTVVGIAAPAVSAWLVGNVLHLWRVNHTLPFAIQFAVTVLSLGCELRALVMAWRARASSVMARFVVGIAGLLAALLLLFAVVGVGMFVLPPFSPR